MRVCRTSRYETSARTQAGSDMRVKSMPDAAFFSRSVTDDRPPGGVSGSSVVIVVKGEKEEGKKTAFGCVFESPLSVIYAVVLGRWCRENIKGVGVVVVIGKARCVGLWCKFG